MPEQKKPEVIRSRIEEITKPHSGPCYVYKDRFWVVVDGCVLFHKQSRTPQCNADETIAQKIRDRLYPGAQVIQIPEVFIPIRVTDFEYRPVVTDRVEHVCGLTGYDPMKDPPCPACVKENE